MLGIERARNDLVGRKAQTVNVSFPDLLITLVVIRMCKAFGHVHKHLFTTACIGSAVGTQYWLVIVQINTKLSRRIGTIVCLDLHLVMIAKLPKPACQDFP